MVVVVACAVEAGPDAGASMGTVACAEVVRPGRSGILMKMLAMVD
jgi:hypothetical protein